LCHIIKLCRESGDWKLLNEYVISLSKKHGQLKQATTKMVQQAMVYLDDTPDMKTKLELVDTLRTVTEGKVEIYIFFPANLQISVRRPIMAFPQCRYMSKLNARA
jgi:26S proteasome regulatory subunit N5